MFPVIHHKELNDFLLHCKAKKAQTVYMSVVPETRPRQTPQGGVIARFLSMTLSAYAIDETTQTPLVIRFWCVEQLSLQHDNGKLEELASDEEVRMQFLGATRLVEKAVGASIIRGELTWLGDPALLPGIIDIAPAELLKFANEALENEQQAEKELQELQAKEAETK